MRRSAHAYWPVVVLLAIDQWSKALARQHLQGSAARTLLQGLVELRFTTNRGALFGHSAGLPTATLRGLLIAIGLGMSLWLARLLFAASTETQARVTWAYRLALAGVLGNTIDRMFSSQVTDFLHLRLGDMLELGTINVADVAVVTSVMLLIPELLRRQTPRSLPSSANIPRS